MNFHTTNTVKKPRKRGAGKVEKRVFSWQWTAKVLFLAGLLFSIFTYRVTLQNESERLNRSAVKIKQRIHQLRREIAYEKIRREQLSDWRHVKRQIKRFKMTLRPAGPYQIRYLDDPAKDLPKNHARGETRRRSGRES